MNRDNFITRLTERANQPQLNNVSTSYNYNCWFHVFVSILRFQVSGISNPKNMKYSLCYSFITKQ